MFGVSIGNQNKNNRFMCGQFELAQRYVNTWAKICIHRLVVGVDVGLVTKVLPFWNFSLFNL